MPFQGKDMFGDMKPLLRKYPYPYHSMLAVCSDLDETPDKNVYWETSRFLNTAQQTSMGTGVDLEVGNTIYFDMPADQFAYWNTDDHGRAMVHDLIQSGHIDCLHSFGDFADQRRRAQKALDALERNNCKLEVWIDHATAPTNFGADIMKGKGDVKNAEAYHADLTLAYGISFIWIGRVTSVIGQDTKRSFSGIWNSGHFKQSSRTLFKEFAKTMLANLNHPKYAIHRTNNVLRQTKLRDGQRVFEFIRSNPHYGGVSCGDNAAGIAEVITPRMLDNLIRRQGVCILYTHLGKIANKSKPFNDKTVKAFRLLAERYRQKQTLVTTTRRLLGYLKASRKTKLSWQDGSNRTTVDIEYQGTMGDLAGITIYTDNPEKTIVTVNGNRFADIIANPPDESGRCSVSLPWHRLVFPG